MFADPQFALCTVQWLLAMALLLFCAEDFRLIRGTLGRSHCSWDVLGRELSVQSPRSFALLAWCFEQPRLELILLVRAALASLLLIDGIFSHASDAGLIVAGLWFTQILLMIRWRGALNGGSDFMVLSLLNALMLGQAYTLLATLWGKQDVSLGLQISLWFITIQSLTSYFVSGAVKLRDPAWRDGRALTHFLNQAVFGPLPASGWFRRPGFAAVISWSFVAWECAMPLLLLGPRLALIACGLALVFHLLVYWYFGLNRFVWAWLCSFPALIYSAHTLSLSR